MLDANENLRFLNETICRCQLCDLSLCRTRAVPGEGPCPAKIMLIGEAPGKDEDLSGRPFVGRAGRLLDEALIGAGLDRRDVFITSAVKCRPPENKMPKAREIEACHAYLQAQMAALEPEVICLMGNTASKAVLGKNGIAMLRGKILDNRFLVTYHPAAVLRNRNLMEAFISDLKKARAHRDAASAHF
jgi:DNA polymerase